MSKAVHYIADYWNREQLTKLDQLSDDEASELIEEALEKLLEPTDLQVPSSLQQLIGEITYNNGAVARLNLPTSVNSTYIIDIQNRQTDLKGMHIPSHRPIYSYQTLQNIPTVPRRRDAAFKTYMEIVRQRYLGHHHQWTPNYFIKETLVALATWGYGNAVVEADAESLDLFQKFESILSVILPPKLGFRKLSIRIPEVVLVTKSGDFSLDAVSGGISAIIDIAWQIFMFLPGDRPFVVTIDEPENHLHPELQRSLLPNLLEAFPAVQFVIASHNPFIVSSVTESNVFILNYDNVNKVNSMLLDTVNKAGSSNEILRDVLGIDFPMPLWVEHKLDTIVKDFEDVQFTRESLERLRQRMTELGLDKYIPDTIARIAQSHFDK